jgi:PAS domain S-box-containing protein
VANENNQILPETARWSWWHISGDPTSKLTLVISLLFLLVMSLYGVVFVSQQQGDMRKQAEARGLALARGMVSIGGVAVLDNLFMVQSALAQIRGQHDIQRIFVLDPEHMVAASDQFDQIGKVLEDKAMALGESRKVETVLSVQLQGQEEESLVVLEPLYRNPVNRTGTDTTTGPLGEPTPQLAGWIRIELSLAQLQNESFARLRQHLFIAVVLLVASLLAVRKIITRLNRHLLESEARLRLTIDTAMDAVIALDEQGVVTEWNPQAAGIFGWSAPEAIGRLLTDLILPSRLRDVWAAEVASVRGTWDRSQTGKRFEITALRRDCTEFSSELSVAAIGLNGHEGYSVFVRDTTELRRAEGALIDAKNFAESTSQAKSEFLANMSHEIRTPMNGVLGMAELLLSTPLSEKQQRLAQTVHRCGIGLLTVINQILDFSKIEAGKFQLEISEFDLRTTVEDVIDLFAETAAKKGLDLTCRVPEGLSVELFGDPMRLRQVLINLVGNAIKFTERGEVVVWVELVRETEEDVLLCLSVRDTGIGIAPAGQAKIFEPFSQADGSTTRKYGGTGLGLAIVKELVALMGGSIRLHSVPSQGSTFTFRVCLRKSARRTLSVVPNMAGLRGARVLIVDDHVTNRTILEEHLTGWGAVYASEGSGPEALQSLKDAAQQRTPYALVLLDMCMPEMDGLAVVRAIKADPLISAAQLIILTSLDQDAQYEKARQLGIEGWLTKPVRQSDLLETLLRVLRSEPLPKAGEEDRPDSSPAPQATSPVRVLLAEDNPVNREVAVGMLEQLDCQVVAVENGRLAVTESQGARFDLVLMDCQMPQMDGFAASHAIRDRERGTGQHLPIVALTAHAIAGDRERCLAAGMDDYLSKPYTQQQLRAMVQRWAKGSPVVEAAAPPSVAAPIDMSGACLDQSILDGIRRLRRPGGPDIFTQIVKTFLGSSATYMQSIRQAASRQDMEPVYQAAHAMKSSSAMVGAVTLSALMKDLEQWGRARDCVRVAALLPDLERAHDAASEALRLEIRESAA